MTKIMIVEDDLALREIYSIRLTAEGYTIVVAGDGEEALAVAAQEKPDLILSDVMMPKISGFDMLDILRSTPELKDTKVVMMTALSSPEQRARGEALGADRYLVKSQVGIEDVVNVIHEVLGDAAAPAPAPAEAAAPAAAPAPAPQPVQGDLNAAPVNPAQ
ncbi:response regulator [Candidatus Saccharibacteria bacterium]|nr:response regulator [Candidatus Saccharibacteria bacterium]